MKLIKNKFSISDLEQLSGIKAHTIRVWEKRYNLLAPERSKTNIRTYSLLSLQKLLNVAYLKNKGYKISNISQFTTAEFQKAIATSIDQHLPVDYYLNEFIIAMYAFDRTHFQQVDQKLASRFSFEQRFENYYKPLLYRIGFLWQSHVITPAHEHFIAGLIKEKLVLQIAAIETKDPQSNEVFILYLPEGELHDIGIYYMQYLLLKNAKKVIYLGASVPLSSLVSMLHLSDRINFISSFTVSPTLDAVDAYLSAVKEQLLVHKNIKFYAWGSIFKACKDSYEAPFYLYDNQLKIKDILL